MAVVLQTLASSVIGIDASEAAMVKEVVGKYAVAAALVVNDVIEMVKVPQGHVLTDLVIDSPDLDTNGTPAIVLAAGVVDNGTSSSCNEIIAASTVAQAGGVAVPNVIGFLGAAALKATAGDLIIGVKVTTAPATGATSGTIYVRARYRPIQDDGQ